MHVLAASGKPRPKGRVDFILRQTSFFVRSKAPHIIFMNFLFSIARAVRCHRISQQQARLCIGEAAVTTHYVLVLYYYAARNFGIEHCAAHCSSDNLEIFA
eukprot:scaffold367191_cov31-Prasinocladus_malaysianus.AAC.1